MSITIHTLCSEATKTQHLLKHTTQCEIQQEINIDQTLVQQVQKLSRYCFNSSKLQISGQQQAMDAVDMSICQELSLAWLTIGCVSLQHVVPTQQEGRRYSTCKRGCNVDE